MIVDRSPEPAFVARTASRVMRGLHCSEPAGLAEARCFLRCRPFCRPAKFSVDFIEFALLFGILWMFVSCFAGRQSAQPLLAAAQKFFEIGRFRPPRLWSRAPLAAALITPRHALFLGAAVGRGGYRVAQLLLQRAVTPPFAA
jgi:hypothetical protein